MDKIDSKNIAVIGAGYWGKNLIRIFSQLEKLGAVCDSDTKKLKDLRKKYPDMNITQFYAEILNDSSIEAVVIATPPKLHYQMTKKALLAEKDVFVEKPLSLTAKDALELIELAKTKNKILMVGHLLEYHPGVNKLKELLQSGKLGEIRYIYSNRLNLGRIRNEENILWSFAPHDISVFLLLLNEMPQKVTAVGGNYLHCDIADVTISNFDFKSGVKGHIFVSWLHPFKEQKLVVIGTKRMAVFDDVAEKDKLLLFNHKIDCKSKVPIFQKRTAERVNFRMQEPLFLECKHFLNSIKTRKNPKTDGVSAFKVLQVLECCQKSLENDGISVSLNSKDTLCD